MAFKPGEVCQFDWSQEVVELGGVEQVVRAAHFRLCYSRKMFVVAYLRETQEILIDAHNKAFDHVKHLNEFCYRFNRRAWEAQLPSTLLNACLNHIQVKLKMV